MTNEKYTNTGVKHIIDGKNYTIYHDTTLKNPLAGFFVKLVDISTGGTARDKKKKVKLTDLSAEKADKLKSLLKNVAKPPQGMKVNPLTGRFIKIGGSVNLKLSPKTFKDPISLATVKKTDGIELNKTWYDKKGLRVWLNSGKNTIPHSRRAFTETEINAIYTDKNGRKIPRKVESNSNNNSNNNSNYNNNGDYVTDGGPISELYDFIISLKRTTPIGTRRHLYSFEVYGADGETVEIEVSKSREGVFDIITRILDEDGQYQESMDIGIDEDIKDFALRVARSISPRFRPRRN